MVASLMNLREVGMALETIEIPQRDWQRVGAPVEPVLLEYDPDLTVWPSGRRQHGASDRESVDACFEWACRIGIQLRQQQRSMDTLLAAGKDLLGDRDPAIMEIDAALRASWLRFYSLMLTCVTWYDHRGEGLSLRHEVAPSDLQLSREASDIYAWMVSQGAAVINEGKTFDGRTLLGVSITNPSRDVQEHGGWGLFRIAAYAGLHRLSAHMAIVGATPSTMGLFWVPVIIAIGVTALITAGAVAINYNTQQAALTAEFLRQQGESLSVINQAVAEAAAAGDSGMVRELLRGRADVVAESAEALSPPNRNGFNPFRAVQRLSNSLVVGGLVIGGFWLWTKFRRPSYGRY